MKQKLQKWFAAVLTFCLVLGMVQIPSVSADAAAADGVIDTSEEGYEIVRYFTGTDTSVTAAQTKNERLEDFFLGTESMTWSVEFQTTGTGLQSLLALNTSDKYYVLYIKSGKLAFEVRGGQTVGQTSGTNYADGSWHTAVLDIRKNGKTTLTVDGEQLAEADTAAGTCIADWTPTAFTIGGVTGYGTAAQTAGWTFSGSMRNIVLKKAVAVAGSTPVLRVVNPEKGGTVAGAGTLESGSVCLTYRLAEEAEGVVSLLAFEEDIELALDLSANAVVISADGASASVPVRNTALNTEKWHNITATMDGSTVSVYVDGVLAGSQGFAKAVNTSVLHFGGEFYISAAELYEIVLSEGQIAELHEATLSQTYPDGTPKMEGYSKTPNKAIFNAYFDGSTCYRIPAIVTSKKTGTVVASIDKRWNGWADVGVIDSVVRRSEDNGTTWGPVISVIDLSDSYAYTVDPAILVDNDETSAHYGRIYMLVDMFPSNIGFAAAKQGTGYTEVDGKKYLKLTDNAGNSYTVRENGIVYDSTGAKTAYQVETEDKGPFTNLGELFKDGVRVGNIYKNSELKAFETCYLWLTYSDDDGITWSTPKDLTPMVKSEWMKFCGTGPGMGLKLQSGRLVFPTYCTNGAGKQSSFNIYSDDDGETWHQGGSPNNGGNMQTATGELTESCIVQLDNGHLIQFMRSYAGSVSSSVSTDEGKTWGTVTTNGIIDPYCQMSAVHYPGLLTDPRDGQEKEAVIFSNPSPERPYSGNGREKGRVRIAFVNEDDTLDWAYAKMIEDGKYLYSSLTVMNNGEIGLIYENESANMTAAAFTSFSPQYLMDENVYESTPIPTGIRTAVFDADGMETDTLQAGSQIRIEVSYEQNVFAAGDVTLNVQVGDETKEAVLIGNVSSDTLAFLYTVEEGDQGKVTAKAEVNVKENGAAETIYNVSLIADPFVTKETVVGVIAEANPVVTMEELPTAGMTATAGSEYAGGTEGPASNVLDGNLNTHWHSNYPADNVSNGGRSKHWITIALGGMRLVDTLKYTPRSGQLNGTVTEYQIEISTDGTNFVPVARGTWQKNADVKIAAFGGAVLASHVKFRVLETNDDWASAGEIRITGTADTSAGTDKTELLQTLLEYADYKDSVEFAGLAESIASAQELAADLKAEKNELDAAAENIALAVAKARTEANEKLPMLLDAAEVKKQEDYTISSWSAYAEALKAARAVNEASSDAEVLKAYRALAAAEEALVMREAAAEALRNEFADLLSEMGLVKKEDYTAESWEAFEAALLEGQRLYEAGNAAQHTAQIYAAMSKIRDAKAALVTVSAKEHQETLAAAAKAAESAKAVIAKGQGRYTSASWKNYTDAYDKLAAAVKAEADTAVLKSLMNALNTAAAGLKTETVRPETLKQGKVYTIGAFKYKVTSVSKKTVTLTGTTDKKKLKTLNIKKTVKILGVTCKITAVGTKVFKNCRSLKKVIVGENVVTIGKQAFAGCSKLKTISVKSKKIKTVYSKAFKGIYKKAVIKVPKSKRAAYKKKFARKGQASGVKIKS